MSSGAPFTDPVAGLDVEELRAQLCGWFVRARRDLPWRGGTDPYPVWISEAMLQQTRVETVVPYYLRFLERFPDVGALAAAPVDDVLALWSGLGYYRRARSLHAAAVLVSELGGRFPVTRVGWLELPGVGPYTAGAVLSIAWQRSEPLVDGNVARVFCRLFGIELDPRSGEGQRLMWSLAEELVPAAPRRAASAPVICPGNWNQALMELGALVCTPRSPDCAACPLREACVARTQGCAAELPRLPPRKKPRPVTLEVLLARSGETHLVVQRPEAGRMSGLWELPTRELADEQGLRHLWPARHAPALEALLEVGDSRGSVSHSITNHRIRADVVLARPRGSEARPTRAEGPEWRWALPEELESLALTGLTRKVLREFA